MRWSVLTVLSRTEHHQSGTDVLTSVGKYAQGDRFGVSMDSRCHELQLCGTWFHFKHEWRWDSVWLRVRWWFGVTKVQIPESDALSHLVGGGGGSKVTSAGHAQCLQGFLHILFIFLMHTSENLKIYLLFTFSFRVTPRLDLCRSRLLGLQLKTKSTSTHHCLPGLSSESFC